MANRFAPLPEQDFRFAKCEVNLKGFKIFCLPFYLKENGAKIKDAGRMHYFPFPLPLSLFMRSSAFLTRFISEVANSGYPLESACEVIVTGPTSQTSPKTGRRESWPETIAAAFPSQRRSAASA